MERTYKGNMLRAAICSYDIQMLRTLGNYFLEYGGFGKCDAYRNGQDLLKDLNCGKSFDVIILDEQMQDMDIHTFLARMHKLKLSPHPLTIAASSHAFLDRMNCSAPRDVDFCVLKPLQAGALARRIQSVYSEQYESIQRYCQALCGEFGVQADVTNTMYLAEAELLVWQANNKLAIRKEIILPVSEAHGISIDSVDSGLRRLIEHMESVNADSYRHFKQATGLPAKKPAIGKMLYAIKRYAVSRKGEGINI